jgi:hypothetical protein
MPSAASWNEFGAGSPVQDRWLSMAAILAEQLN